MIALNGALGLIGIAIHAVIDIRKFTSESFIGQHTKGLLEYIYLCGFADYFLHSKGTSTLVADLLSTA